MQNKSNCLAQAPQLNWPLSGSPRLVLPVAAQQLESSPVFFAPQQPSKKYMLNLGSLLHNGPFWVDIFDCTFLIRFKSAPFKEITS